MNIDEIKSFVDAVRYYQERGKDYSHVSAIQIGDRRWERNASQSVPAGRFERGAVPSTRARIDQHVHNASAAAKEAARPVEKASPTPAPAPTAEPRYVAIPSKPKRSNADVRGALGAARTPAPRTGRRNADLAAAIRASRDDDDLPPTAA